jgi:hypothetical protein
VGGFTSYNALLCLVAVGPPKYGKSQGYARMQSLRIMRTAEAAVKKLLLSGVAALFLATGAVNTII